MPTRSPSFSREALLSRLRPTSHAGQGVSAPVNAEVRKATQDVLDAMKYSYAAVAANPSAQVRSGSVEQVFQQVIASRPKAVRARAKATAQALVSAKEEVRKAQFGRYGSLSAKEILGSGALRADEIVGAVALSRAGLGIKEPSLNLRPVGLSIRGGNLVAPLSSVSNLSMLDLDLEGGDLEDGDIDFDLEDAVQSRFARKAEHGVVNDSMLEQLYGIELGEDPSLDMDLEGTDDLEGQSVLDKLRLEIREVRCIDETNPEWPGDDEIVMGGTSIDENGDTKKINKRTVSNSFDDGEVRRYNPYLNFHWFNVNEGKSWPKKYVVAIALAEEDNGGFANFLNTIYQQVKAKIREVLINIVGTALEVYLGKFIANVIAQAVAWLVHVLIGWIIDWFRDDIFPIHTATMNHAGLHARFSHNGQWGYAYSSWMYGHFVGHGGHYRVMYRWRLYA